MSQVLNLIKNKLLLDSFYIPTLDKEVKGSTFTINQYNNLLEISAEDNETKKLNYVLYTDDIIKSNLESIEGISYYDKVFILLQMKLSQSLELFGVNNEKYKETLRNRCKEQGETTFKTNYTYNGISIELGHNNLKRSIELNQQILVSEDIEVSNLLTSEIIRSITKIEFDGSEVDLNDIKPDELISSLPASFMETFNKFNATVADNIIGLNKFVYRNEEISLYPSLDIMLL